MPLSSIPAAGPSALATTLGRDFGDAPLGRLGGRSVSAPGGAAPRAAGPSLGQRIQGLLSRRLDAATPAGVRASGKFQRAVEDLSRGLGEVLGTVQGAGGPVDGTRLQRGLLEATRLASEVGRRSGDPAAGLARGAMQARIDQHLGRLDDDALHALAGQLRSPECRAALDGLSAPSPEALGTAVLLESRINAALVERTESTAADRIDAALAKAADASAEPGPATAARVDDLVSQAQGHAHQAHDRLAQDGVRALSGEDGHRYRAGLVKDGLERMPAAQRDALMPQIGTAELRQLLAGRGVRSDTPLSDAALRAEVGARLDRQTSAFHEAAARLLAHPQDALADEGGPLRAPQAFAAEVASAADALAALRTHADTHGLRIDAAVDGRLAAVITHLDELLRPSRMLPEELSGRQLQGFQKALATLGSEGAAAPLAREADSRRDAAHGRFEQALGAVVDAARMGDQATLLDQLGRLTVQSAETRKVFGDLGRPIDDLNKILAFQDEMLDRALAAMPAGEALGLWVALTDGPGQALQEALGRIGGEVVAAYPELGRTVVDAGQQLEMLQQAVERRLDQAGQPLPAATLPGEPAAAARAAAGFRAEARAALSSAYVIDVGVEGTARVMSGWAPAAMQEAVRESATVPSGGSDQAHIHNGMDTGVNTEFWRDLIREPDHYLRQGGDAFTDTSSWDALDLQGRGDRLVQGLGAMRTWLGGGPEADRMLARIAQVAYQSSLAGISQTLLSEDSPVRLPDGRAGQPLNGTDTKRFSFSRTADGEVRMRVDFRMEGLRNFLSIADGRMEKLKPQESRAFFSYEVGFAQDGTITLTEPVQYLFQIEVDPWPKDYPMPRTATELLASTNSDLAQDFLQFARSKSADENYIFARAFERFAVRPTQGVARALADGLLDLNLSGEVADNIQAIRAGLHGQDHDPAPATMFDRAYAELRDNLEGTLFVFRNAVLAGGA